MRHAEVGLDAAVTGQLQTNISNVDLWKTQIRVLVRGPGQTQDISKLVDNLTWNDQSSDNLEDINTQAAMVGTVELRKPNLRQYKTLAPLIFPGDESFSGRAINWGGTEKASFGAMGAVVICQVGYGSTWQNVWAMRVVPGWDTGVADQINLSDGAWTLNLADDLWTLAQSVADFNYTKRKKVRPNGYRCDEIAADICQKYRIPVRTLSKGTAYFGLGLQSTSLTSPLDVITQAYAGETRWTGRTFVIRWGAPDAKYPTGALEVVPMRRNRLLLKMREQIIEATLSRSQGADFATIIQAHGWIKLTKGSRNVYYTAVNDAAVKRFGWIRKTVNYGQVSSEAELAILAKRSLAVRLTPIRAAEVTHPGVATIRRGDAVYLDIPEEGYANVQLTAYETPTTKGMTGVQAAALRDAEKLDPSLFAMPDAGLATTDPTQASNTPAADANVQQILPSANQAMVYVTSVTHTVSAGDYEMDMVMGFTNVLDPNTLRAQVDAAVRAHKAGKWTSVTTESAVSGGTTTG